MTVVLSMKHEMNKNRANYRDRMNQSLAARAGGENRLLHGLSK